MSQGKVVKLTAKQEAFVSEYLIDLNATQAAIRAGYSARTAEWQGPQLLRKTHVAAEIAAAKAQRSERTKIDADWVLNTLAAEKTADLADLYDDTGNLLPVKKWPMVFRTGLVVGIETSMERDGTDEDGAPQFVSVRKVKLQDRTKTTELIGRHVTVGAFKDRIEIEDVTDRATQMRQRRDARLAKTQGRSAR